LVVVGAFLLMMWGVATLTGSWTIGFGVSTVVTLLGSFLVAWVVERRKRQRKRLGPN
jgi:membrane protein implicated in regulation of membrane protease activity